jgi:hypothetical protein
MFFRIGFRCVILTLILSFLKLMGAISWSWLWVLFPFLAYFSLCTFILIVLAFFIQNKIENL